MTKLDRVGFRKLVARHRVNDGEGFRLKAHDPADTGPFSDEDKEHCRELLQHSVGWLADAQAKLYAQDRWALLLILQAMDAADPFEGG
ncbi:MAG: hypothetical protein EXR95_03015 [Gemmatimonadetes bacterium]|nr:hypothetical protein [Gemmatimonadota bacterium]